MFVFAAITSYFFFDGQIETLNSYHPDLNFYVVPVVVSVNLLSLVDLYSFD